MRGPTRRGKFLPADPVRVLSPVRDPDHVPFVIDAVDHEHVASEVIIRPHAEVGEVCHVAPADHRSGCAQLLPQPRLGPARACRLQNLCLASHAAQDVRHQVQVPTAGSPAHQGSGHPLHVPVDETDPSPEPQEQVLGEIDSRVPQHMVGRGGLAVLAAVDAEIPDHAIMYSHMRIPSSAMPRCQALPATSNWQSCGPGSAPRR